MESTSDYIALKKLAKELKRIFYEFRSDKSIEGKDFGDLEVCLNILGKYPVLSSLEEVRSLRYALDIARHPKKSFFEGQYPYSGRAGESIGIVCSNINSVVHEIEKECVNYIPKNPETKTRIIQAIKVLKEMENKLDEESKKIITENTQLPANELLSRLYIAHRPMFTSALGNLKCVPGIDLEDGYEIALKNLENNQIEMARKQIDALVGKIKSDYGIDEGEIKEPEDVRKLKNELENSRMRETGLINAIGILRESTTQLIVGKPKPLTPKERVDKIRIMINKRRTTDEITLEMLDLALDLISVFGDTDVGVEVMGIYRKVREKVPPKKNLKDSPDFEPYETDIWSILNKVEQRQERYRSHVGSQ